MIRIPTALFLSGALLFAAGAPARVVHLAVLNGEEGQGWMFLDEDGHCKVVTAAHVVRSLAGRLRVPIVTDDHGHTWTAATPFQVSTYLDIAVVPLPAADNPLDCGTGRISAIGAEARVENMQAAVIETADGGAVEQLPVEHRASAMDATGGEHFSVRFRLQKDRIRKGLSGGIVADSEGPLGVVTNVDIDRDEVDAVRVDAVRLLLDGSISSLAPPTKRTPQIYVSGVAAGTPDPDNGPQQSLSGSGSAWHAKPLNRTITLIAQYPSAVSLSEVRLSGARQPGNAIKGLDVSTQAGAADVSWVDGNYCPVALAPAISCRLSPRNVVRLRIVVRTETDQLIDIADLSVR